MMCDAATNRFHSIRAMPKWQQNDIERWKRSQFDESQTSMKCSKTSLVCSADTKDTGDKTLPRPMPRANKGKDRFPPYFIHGNVSDCSPYPEVKLNYISHIRHANVQYNPGHCAGSAQFQLVPMMDCNKWSRY